MDHNDAGHAADTGHDANANAMRMLEREGRADFYKSKDSLINDNFISLFGSQFKLLAVVLHHFLSCCLCNLFAIPPLPSLVAPPSLSCAASLSCWLVVASPPLSVRDHISCAGYLLNCHLSPHIAASLYHALHRSLDVVVAAALSLPPLDCHHRRCGNDRSSSRRILLLLPATSVSMMSTSSTTTFANHADRQVHPDVLLHLLCQHIHLNPLDQNLLVVRDAIINLPVVEVKRRRDGGG